MIKLSADPSIAKMTIPLGQVGQHLSFSWTASAHWGIIQSAMAHMACPLVPQWQYSQGVGLNDPTG